MEAMLEHHDGIALFTICRPEKRNAINFAVMGALEEAMEQAAADPQVKVFAITGAGSEAFCSGGDLSEFGHLRGTEARQMLMRMGELLYRLLTFPKPTAALVNGTAIGGRLRAGDRLRFSLCQRRKPDRICARPAWHYDRLGRSVDAVCQTSVRAGA